MIELQVAAHDEGAAALDLPAEPAQVRLAAGRHARELPVGEPASVDASGVTGERLAALVEGLLLGGYRFSEGSRSGPPPATVVRLCGAADDDAIERGRAAAAATCWARDLANARAEKTPAWLARQAADVLAPLDVDVTERDANWLAEQGFGGVLAVAQGSPHPPRLIEASWAPRGRGRSGPHVVLVGKGITFDTGGLNRKTGDGMRTMFTDMAGGAAVLGTVRAIAQRQLPVRVTALVPTAENAFSGGSYRPSDVIRHVGGRTSEIRNTDAEGRLVLADALAYAAARLRPTALVDVATLTGAMKVSLGLRIGGLLATEDELADGLLAAGIDVDERLWRLPLYDEYEAALSSDIADANNSPGNPGGITAALFLKPFTGGVPWAHLDVAGPARAPEDDGVLCQGATGFGVRLLTRWVAGTADASEA